jgi:FkbM family methyltransferase
MSALNGLLGTTQKALSRSQLAVFAARMVRNQAEMVLQWYLGQDNKREANGEQALIAEVAPNLSSFVDVGANVGDWSDLFLHAGSNHKRGILIEPSGSAFAKLRARFGQNSQVRIIRSAVSNEMGESCFFEESNAGETSSLLDFSHPEGAGTNLVRVPVTTVDRETSAAGWDSVDMLKIDTEGYDFHVIRGAGDLLRRKAIGFLQFEYGAGWAFAGSTLAAALRFLEDRDYKVFLIRTTGLHPLNYHRWGEYYRTSNYLAVSPQSMPLVTRLIQSEI